MIKQVLISACMFTIFISLSSCKKEDESANEQNSTPVNNLIGTWKWTSATDYYWYQMVFNQNLSGARTDADGENNTFSYSFTTTKVNFTSGFPNGEYNYFLVGSTKLVLFGDTLIKQ